jgi:hypothetical protein
VVETGVEAERPGQRIRDAAVDPTSAPSVAGERRDDDFETLPERLGALGLVLLTALEGLLAVRFLLVAFGDNTSGGFVGSIDNMSWPFVRPLADVFSNRYWNQGIVEISTLVAMGSYLLVFALLGMLVTALAPRLIGHLGRGRDLKA